MAVSPNQYHLLTFDPGGTIGWAALAIDARAFSRPEHKVLPRITSFKFGELHGTEIDQLAKARELIYQACFGRMPYQPHLTNIVTEDFELTQRIGGANLLSPVRINAVLQWHCYTNGIVLQFQKRGMRTGVTKERLIAWGLPKHRYRKDEFAAVQHAFTWVRRVKKDSISHPWKLAHNGVMNAFWDCACDDGLPCDLVHPFHKPPHL